MSSEPLWAPTEIRDRASEGLFSGVAEPEASEDEATPATVWLNRAIAEAQLGHADRARVLFAKIGERLSDWDEPFVRLAESFRAEGDRTSAMAAYERALERNPRRAEALLGLGCLHLQSGDWRLAEPLILRSCGEAPDCAEAWDALGASLLLSDDAAAAESAFAEGQRLDPGNLGIALRRLDASLAAGRGEAECDRLAAALVNEPANAVLLCARGVLLDHLGRRVEAIDDLELAVALKPDCAISTAVLAHCLARENRVSQAIRHFESAIVLSPDDVGLRNNYAATLIRAHRHREARELLEALIAEHGEQVGFLCNLANALVSLGLQDEGLDAARRATRLDPTSNTAWRAVCNALPYCEVVGGQELLNACRNAGRTVPRSGKAPAPAARDPERRIRLGLLSPAFKVHPVGWLTVGAFEALDPEAFEIICIGPHYAEDPIQRRFRSIASDWHVPDMASNGLCIDRLKDLAIDILVDLGGYGDHGMMALCAERLAPVQVKWVGSQNHSSGMAEMDWFLTDQWETPAEFSRFYSERLLALPDGYVCYSPPAYAPAVAPLPALANDGLTFGCFNNLAKVNPKVVRTWSAIMSQMPRSRLIIKCHQMADAPTRARLLAAFGRSGITPDRLELRRGSPHRELLRQYGDVDIALDPFPYSGGLTTCEALWMGVPTITMPGETFASRHSTSHMSNVGLGEWVADDPKDYERLAGRWADDIPALARLRQGLRERVRQSPLCDAPRFGRNLGSALRHAWREACGRDAN
jgi:protein O-GlcNAc transferase